MSEVRLPTRIRQFDGLRGFAAIYVVITHFVLMHINTPALWPESRTVLLNSIFHSGTWAVQIFFCISGFLVFGSLKKAVSNHPHPFRAFYIRRAFRILPLWWFVVLLRFVSEKFDASVMIANLFFIFGFLPFPKFFPILSAWSLFAEETFYLILPTVFRFILRPVFLLATIIFAIVVSRIWVHNGLRAFSPPAQFQFFLLGIAVQNLYSLDLLEKRNLTRALDIVLVGLFAASAFFDSGLPPELSVPILVLSVLHPKSLFNLIFDNRFFRWAGVRCYGIYLLSNVGVLHWPMGLLMKYFGVFGQPAEVLTAVFLPAMILWTLFLAHLSFKFLERPLIRFGERIASKGSIPFSALPATE